MADNRLGGGFLAPCWISASNNGFFFLLLPAGDWVVLLLLVVDFNAAFLVMSPKKDGAAAGRWLVVDSGGGLTAAMDDLDRAGALFLGMTLSVYLARSGVALLPLVVAGVGWSESS